MHRKKLIKDLAEKHAEATFLSALVPGPKVRIPCLQSRGQSLGPFPPVAPIAQTNERPVGEEPSPPASVMIRRVSESMCLSQMLTFVPIRSP